MSNPLTILFDAVSHAIGNSVPRTGGEMSARALAGHLSSMMDDITRRVVTVERFPFVGAREPKPGGCREWRIHCHACHGTWVGSGELPARVHPMDNWSEELDSLQPNTCPLRGRAIPEAPRLQIPEFLVHEPESEPKANERHEGGPTQFGDDWPGVFLRGDFAGPMAFTLSQLLTQLLQAKAIDPINHAVLSGLARSLGAAEVHEGQKVTHLKSFGLCRVDATDPAHEELIASCSKLVEAINEDFCGYLPSVINQLADDLRKRRENNVDDEIVAELRASTWKVSR